MAAKYDLNDDSVVVIIGTGAGGGRILCSSRMPCENDVGTLPSTRQWEMFAPRRKDEFQWFFTELSVRPGR